MDLRGNWILPIQTGLSLYSDSSNIAGFGDGVTPAMQDDLWGYIANPLVYPDSWEKDEFIRAESLGVAVDPSETPISCDAFWRMIESILPIQKELQGKGVLPSACDFDIAGNSLSEILGLSYISGDDPITRQEAAAILTALSAYYGNVVEAYNNYCADSESVDEEYSSAVAYAASLGVFDTPENTFSPQATLIGKEATIVTLRLFEEMLDVHFDTWSSDEHNYGYSTD